VTKASVAGTPGEDLPVGAGLRVRCWAISLWSVGKKVFSSDSDHTSCLQLIEAVAAASSREGSVDKCERSGAEFRAGRLMQRPSLLFWREVPVLVHVRPTVSSTFPGVRGCQRRPG
jgi:hypothetical protein